MHLLLSSLTLLLRHPYHYLQRQLHGRTDTCAETLHGIQHLLDRWSSTGSRDRMEQLGVAIDELTDRIVEQGDGIASVQRLQLMHLRSLLLQLFHATRMEAQGARAASLLHRAQDTLHAVLSFFPPVASVPVHLLN